ncbi:MAG TPA: fumarylacetoacetate hydrolase family protein, partial [Ramlibacter sp.]|nr:fumarylacetoacetate hydrolase family protein [Ramlibacter sp.]
MKLASLKDGGRDGSLVVVSRDLTRAIAVPEIAETLQSALDRWDETEPALRIVAERLEGGLADGAFAFDPARCAAPLPRAYQWCDGSAYVNHVELVRKARGADMPPSFWTDPLMYQGGSDRFIGPCDPIEAISEAHGIDLEAEVAVITDDVPMAVTPEHAAGHVKLLMLVNDVSLRGLIPAELAKGFGFFHSKPASSFSPVAVTPDELGPAWRDNKVHLPLLSWINGREFGRPEAGVDMTFDFARLIAHAAATRHLGARTIIGS